MNIAPIGQDFAASNPQSGRNLPPVEKESVDGNSEAITKSAKQVDLRDISINELNDLIKSGEFEGVGVAPFISPHILQQYDYDPDAIGNHRVDLLGQVEETIAFQNHIGEDTARLDAVLEDLKRVDGTYFPERIDINV
ncbi:hypothetical protein [Aquisalimonas asiatica]|uniref:hypothetical protein n=1 Tax=Aquisalimonas asiatica TaxID=406100 RepID=UPI001113DC69|nr:hypothetical protein [Aquisalimonas asiatica]